MDLMSVAQLLGNFGEFFGAIAVVVTLAYLAVPISQGTHATRAASRDAAMAHTLSFFQQGLDNQVIARAEHKRVGGQQLDDFEQHQLLRYQSYNFKIFENIHTHHEQGVIPDDEWEYFRGIMKLVLTINEEAVELCANTRESGLWKSDFIREVDDLLSSK